MQKISVIIPTIAGREAMLQRLFHSMPNGLEVIVMGDESMPLSVKRNEGGWQAHGDILLFIDDDNHLAPGAIAAIQEWMTDDIGIMGIVACYDDDPEYIADGGSRRFLLSGFQQGQHTNRAIAEIDKSQPYDVDEVANAFAVRRVVFEQLGGFDYKLFPIDLDEADLCLRAKNAGWRVVMNPRAVCYHNSQTYSAWPDFRRPKNAYYMGRNRVLFQRKHLTALGYAIYAAVFMPMFVAFYVISLARRKKFHLMPHYLKGVYHGLRGRTENCY